MNRTLKVVFNKARGVLMVANEITSSVQKKGTKTVVATAVATAFMASSAVAGTIYGGGAAYVGSGAFESFNTAVTAVQGENGLVVTAKGFDNQKGYGAVVNSYENSYQEGSRAEVHIAKGSSFENNKAQYGAGMVLLQEGGSGGHGFTENANTIVGTTFSGNEAGKNGGALALFANGAFEEDGSTTISQSTFVGNKAGADAGAVYVEATKAILNNGTLFDSNESVGYGGAVYVHAHGASLTVDGANFKNNSAGKSGGAIMLWSDGKKDNDQKFSIKGTFDGNTAANKGGAIAWLQMEATQTKEQSLSIVDSSFTNNGAAQGGALCAEDDVTISGKTTFVGNEASKYGGAIVHRGGALKITGADFENNVAGEVGGAIATVAETSVSLELDNVQFINNQSYYDGGAIGSYSGLKISNAYFEGNVAQYDKDGNPAEDTQPVGGGAISFGSLSNADVVSVSSTKFVNNRSGANGGAIGTRLAKDGSVELAKLNIAATFEGNQALKSGGAFYNSFHNVTLSGVFTNNVAGEEGGAFYNSGNNVVLKDASFSGNKDKNGLNDIHNVGNINVQGNLTLDGGVSGDGTLVFEKDSVLTVKADTTEIANTVNNEGATLNMTFAAGYAGGEYQLVTGTLDKEFNVDVNNSLYTVTAKEGALGTYVVAAKSAAEVAQDLTQTTTATANEAAAAAAMASASAAGTNETFRQVAESIVEGLQSSDPAVKQAAVDALAAVNPEVAAVVVETATSTGTAVMGAIGNHLNSNMGAASGDMFEESALWVQAMGGKTDMDDTSKAKGYEADSYGVAVGTEAKINSDVRVGVGYAFTKTDIDADTRDTDVDSHTAFVYGEWKPAAECYVNGMMSYSWGDYEESNGAMGQSWKSEYDVDTFGMQVMTGHNFKVQGATLSPEIGVRYFHIRQGEYTNGMDTKVSASSNDVFTGVLGAKLSKAFEMGSTVVKPEARVAVTYDFADADNDSFVTLANGASYNVEGETLDKFGVEVGVGVTAEVNDNLEFSFVYDGAFRGDYKNHAALINAKYKF